jgi:hypothetical protein
MDLSRCSGISAIYRQNVRRATESKPDEMLIMAQTLNHSERHYQSGDVPPIRELSFEEANAAIQIMSDNMKGWDYIPQPVGSERINHIDQRDWRPDGTKRTVQERWNSRIMDTKNTLIPPDSDATKIFAYYVDNVPVGIMAMECSNPPEILQLVTHPGSEGVGGSLLEQAVKQSLEWGDDGSVSLVPVTEDARHVYETWGFSATGEWSITLNPAESQGKFVQGEDGQWKLKSHFGEGYIHSCSLHL